MNLIRMITESSRQALLRRKTFPLLALHRDTFALMASTVLVSLLGFLTWKIITLLFSPSQVGIGAVGLSSATFLAGLANLGLTTGLVRFMPQLPPRDKATLAAFSHLATGGLAVMLTVLFLAGREWWARDFPASGLYVAAFASLVIANALMSIHEAVLQAERRTPYLLVKNAVVNVARLGLVFILPVTLGSVSILAATLFPTAIVALALFWMIPLLTRGAALTLKFRPSLLRPFVSYSLANQLFSISWSLPAFAFPLLVLNRLGAEANAYFAVTWLFASLTLIIPNSVSVALLIEGSHAGIRLAARARTALKTSVVLLAPVVLGVVILSPIILRLFGADYAANGVTLLRLLVVAALPGAVPSVYLTVLQVRKQVVSLNVVTLLLSGSAILLSWLLTRWVGLVGIGWGWLISQSLFAALLIRPLLSEWPSTTALPNPSMADGNGGTTE